ncbi:MAG: aldo/keto reductase [Spirochaetales bacterium]|nr:aldo/keto reductase [Spirochaetales bacterium]
MKTKRLGTSDLDITVIGLGTWAIGGGAWQFGWGPQDDDESIRTIHRALDLGINWIDTAAVYGIGRSEEVVGKAIKGMSGRPLIATKCGRIEDKNGRVAGNLKKESVKKEAEDSLKRLGIETIDLYQIHWPDPEEDIEEGWEAVSALIKEGKIRCGGVSNFNVGQLERITPIRPPVSLQPPYSMIRRGIEEEIIPYCGKKNIGIVCYSPMYKGLLTGKIDREWVSNIKPDDHRRNDPHFREPELSVNMAFIDNLKAVAEKLGTTLPRLAIAWVRRRPEVTAAIVGARRVSQIEETVKAAELELTPDVIAEIDGLIGEREKRLADIA